MKKHNFEGQPASHGSMMHRRNGAIGNRSTPGRIWKNMGMPGHMGDERVTVQNLRVVQVREEEEYPCQRRGSRRERHRYVDRAPRHEETIDQAKRNSDEREPVFTAEAARKANIELIDRTSERHVRPCMMLSWPCAQIAARGTASTKTKADVNSSRRQTLAAKRHRPRARRLQIVAGLGWRRRRLRTASARLLQESAEEGQDARVSKSPQRARSWPATSSSSRISPLTKRRPSSSSLWLRTAAGNARKF